jgi:hypothetical protein
VLEFVAASSIILSFCANAIWMNKVIATTTAMSIAIAPILDAIIIAAKNPIQAESDIGQNSGGCEK